jgi:hypothetical protein
VAPKTKCTACGAEILQTTAATRGGLCAPCAKGTRSQIDAARGRASEPRHPRPEQPNVVPSVAVITDVLDSVVDPEAAQDLARIEGALTAIHRTKDAAGCVPALLRVFERFPSSDGLHSFWGILHSLEALPGYEKHLITSVRRTPGEFNLLMINRLLNGGVLEIDGTSLLGILDEVASSMHYSEPARSQARSFIEHQRSSRGPG